jgi:hypothetical protein
MLPNQWQIDVTEALAVRNKRESIPPLRVAGKCLGVNVGILM